jgi:hypothetical protein
VSEPPLSEPELIRQEAASPGGERSMKGDLKLVFSNYARITCYMYQLLSMSSFAKQWVYITYMPSYI